MNSTSNSEHTFCFDDSNKELDILFCVCIAILIVLTVSGNLLVIISISHFKVLQTPTNVLILSLATADLIVGLLSMPFLMLSKTCIEMDFMFCFIFMLFSYIVNVASIYTVALISLDRFYALSDPFEYSKKVTVKMMSVTIAIMWLLSAIYNSVSLHYSPPCSGDVSTYFLVAFIDLMVVFILPCSLIVVMSIRIFLIVRKHAKRIRDSRGKQISKKCKENIPKESEQKAAKKLGVLVIVFILCLLPLFIFVPVGTTLPEQIFDQAFHTTMAILQMNSMINPIIYALSYPWFRRTVKLILMLRILQPDSSLINVLSESG